MELTKNTEGNERKKEYCRVKNDEYEKTTTYRFYYLFSILLEIFVFRTLDRKAVDMLSAKVKEKANALKEYLKDRPEAEFWVNLVLNKFKIYKLEKYFQFSFFFKFLKLNY